MKSFVMTKWCKEITDSGKNEYTGESTKGFPYKFRLLDDDETIYGYGYSKTNNDEDAFAPLDYYMYSLGVTIIEYWDNKTQTWEML